MKSGDMTMLEYFTIVGVVSALNGVLGIPLGILLSKRLKPKPWQSLVLVALTLTSCLSLLVNGYLIIGFELAFENWSALQNPSELLTYHFMIFCIAFLLNLTSGCLNFIRLVKPSKQ